MIKIDNVDVYGFDASVRGLRNPMNSWDKSDSTGAKLGKADLDLMLRMNKAGSEESKYRRMITVTFDTVAPLYWYKEMDTYKVGTVCNSCSTMHKIHSKPFELDDFSHEHIGEKIRYEDENPEEYDFAMFNLQLEHTICVLNYARKRYIETKNKKYWWQLIQLLPSSYNQRRTYQMNYEVLASIYRQRKHHKLDEWKDFCHWIEDLPYSELITGVNDVTT